MDTTTPSVPTTPVKRGRGRPRKHPINREALPLRLMDGKRVLTAKDLESAYSITRAIRERIPLTELPRIEINKRVIRWYAEDVESYLMTKRKAA